MSELLGAMSGWVWGAPLMVLLVGTGLFLTFRLAFIQLRGFSHAVRILTGCYDQASDPGEVSHFRALSTALSATIGTGNIVGVAAAILAGGPGAVFWMWVTACVGMATKFSSCTLAVYFRKVTPDGETHGGPMYFIEQGLGPRWRWLAVMFASCAALASFGIGNMFQVNSIVTATHQLAFGQEAVLDFTTRWIVGGFVAAGAALVILGGIKRIAYCAGFLVPFMCGFYILAGLVILLKNSASILPALQSILYFAFHTPEALGGGLLGTVIRSGVARGLFSNEAGLGSAAMAHGAAKTKEPVREGLVAMLGPCIDTLIVCTITALVIISTGAHEVVSHKGQLTSFAFEQGWQGTGWVVNVGIILFAFSTLIAWSYYGDRAVAYLWQGSEAGRKHVVLIYRWIYVSVIILGALKPLDDVIHFSDITNGLMALPNLWALIMLSPVVVKLSQSYFKRMKHA